MRCVGECGCTGGIADLGRGGLAAGTATKGGEGLEGSCERAAAGHCYIRLQSTSPVNEVMRQHTGLAKIEGVWHKNLPPLCPRFPTAQWNGVEAVAQELVLSAPWPPESDPKQISAADGGCHQQSTCPVGGEQDRWAAPTLGVTHSLVPNEGS